VGRAWVRPDAPLLCEHIEAPRLYALTQNDPTRDRNHPSGPGLSGLAGSIAQPRFCVST